LKTREDWEFSSLAEAEMCGCCRTLKIRRELNCYSGAGAGKLWGPRMWIWIGKIWGEEREKTMLNMQMQFSIRSSAEIARKQEERRRRKEERQALPCTATRAK
jgi:hypothetical protein